VIAARAGMPGVRRLPWIALAVMLVAAGAIALAAAAFQDPQPQPLRWPPPPLENPIRIAVDDARASLTLEPGRDYVLDLPDRRRPRGLHVVGGRNVVIIGGHVTVASGALPDYQRKALSFASQTGTIHVEGVLIDASGGGEGDGISVNAPEAVVQLQNLRVVGLRGSELGTHADVVQLWGGARALRIHRLTGSSHFQGLQLPRDQGAIGRAVLREIDLAALPARPYGGGHMLWLTLDDCDGYPVRLRQVWVRTRATRSFRTAIWPEARRGVPCGARWRGGGVGWPGLPVDGRVRRGRPPGGSFVPPGVAGPDYVSPGYRPSGSAG
jgi:hypothetical protein